MTTYWALRSAFGAAAVALLLASQSFGQASPPKPDAKADTKDAKEAAKDTKDAAKDVKDDAKDAAKDVKDDAKDTAKDAKDDAKDAAKDTKDTAKEARDDVKDRAKDTRDAAKDTAKDTAKDARDTAKDTSRDARDTARDRADARDRDARPSDRDRDRDARDSRDRDPRDRDDRAAGDRDARDTRDPRDRDPRDTRDRDARDTRDRDDREVRDRDARDRDTRDRDVARDRDSRARDSRTDIRTSSTSFRASDIRSADIGLWFDSSVSDGLVISDVATSGAITKLGFQEGDRIVSIDGRRVTRERDFVEYLFADDVRDQRVKVIVLRDEKEEVIWVEPSVLVEDYRYVDNDPVEHFGVVLDDRYDDRIVVWRVVPQSPAYYAGIRAGDVFTTFRGQPVTTRDDFVRVVRDLDAGVVPVQVTRNDRVRDVRVDVPEFQARTERRTALRPNVDVERPNERREQRIEERREDRRDVTPPRAVTPAPATPGRAPAPAPGRTPVLPRRR